MFKYEVEITAANEKYQEYLRDEQWAELAEFFAFHGSITYKGESYDNMQIFSLNARIAIIKYYSFIEGTGFVRVKESKLFGVDRSDRDNFERNKVDYPHKAGLYLIGQTFFNPKTYEEYYWVKPGWATDLKRRRDQYNTTTPMIWDIGYYLEDDLTEKGCHEKLRQICLHRHADEWFSVSQKDYQAICENGFDWFKEA